MVTFHTGCAGTKLLLLTVMKHLDKTRHQVQALTSLYCCPRQDLGDFNATKELLYRSRNPQNPAVSCYYAEDLSLQMKRDVMKLRLRELTRNMRIIHGMTHVAHAQYFDKMLESA